ncbi:nuclear transport factor 2 family protein [Nostoc sp. MG11]|uniref:nuclear transport factor 2 family protein n=1 Tax=Nostoc sp. MG11 TaxID=2721166 RepID=UPI001867C9F0|nr:nuclear transport factor 2 family protein [Nostoc sp. MG11]
MRTDKLRINQLSPQIYEWYLAYLQSIDSKNIEGYGTFLADDCLMQTNNHPPVVSKAAILRGLSEYWTSFDSLTHDLLNIYGTDSSFVLEALNHYKCNDGKLVTVKAVAITDRNQTGLVTSIRLYSDTTPLFA